MTPAMFTPQFWLAVLLALVLAIGGGYFWGAGATKNAMTAVHEKEKAEIAAANLKALQAAIAFNEAMADQQAGHNRDVMKNYENTIADLRSRPRSRLRLPAGVCGDATAAAQAQGAGQADGAAAGTGLLPPWLGDRLYDRAERADDLSEQVRAFQAWAEKHGFAPD